METEDHQRHYERTGLGNGTIRGIRRGPWRQRTMETEDHEDRGPWRQRTIRGIRRERGLGTAPSEALGEDHGDRGPWRQRTIRGIMRERGLGTAPSEALGEDHGERGPWRQRTMKTEDHEDRGP
uniref:Uncharacterized protein n=1 Tax=Knipowitschia caucasica TaxID=637954 RepID=A0AAV2LJ27_KNICA